MHPSNAMIEAGATALANEAGTRRGAPRITNVLSALPQPLADQFRDDAKAAIEVALSMIPLNTYVDRDGAMWTLTVMPVEVVEFKP